MTPPHATGLQGYYQNPLTLITNMGEVLDINKTYCGNYFQYMHVKSSCWTP